MNKENCKRAKVTGTYLDELRENYPYHIFARGYDAYLSGVYRLSDGTLAPEYMFPGGKSMVDNVEIQNVVEW